MPNKCLNPSCKRPPSARGLCHTCYRIAVFTMEKYSLTWAQLIEAGKALPKKKAGPETGERVKWFLDGIK